MIKVRITTHDDNNIPDTLKHIAELNRKVGKVGYPSGSTQEMIARVHEFGARIAVTAKMRKYLAKQGLYLKKSTTHITIPERSFLRTGADNAERDLHTQADALKENFVAGKIDAEEFLELLALTVRGKIQEQAIDLNAPVNHPFTVEMKGSNNPLVNSGGLIGSMEVEVE